MKSRIRHLSLCLALGLAAAVRAQTPEPAPLPDQWARIEKAVDLSLDQIQTLRTIVASRDAALAEWTKANGATAESLRQEVMAARKANNTDLAATLEARRQPLQAERNAIKDKFEKQMEDVLRPEQKAAWQAVSHNDEAFRLILELPDLTDAQRTRAATTFKDFTMSLGRWDADKSAAIEALDSRGLATAKARKEADAAKTDQRAALRKEQAEIQAAQDALRAEREKLESDGYTQLLDILTPEQCLVVKTRAFQLPLENKLRKLNPTPEQLAAVKVLCETEAKALTTLGKTEYNQARERLQKAIFEKILTEEQRQALSAKPPMAGTPAPVPQPPVPAAAPAAPAPAAP